MPGTTYFGEVRIGPGDGGMFTITIPDDATAAKPRHVVGHMRVGALPKQALTGFSGDYAGGLSFSAKGENKRGEGVEGTMFLVVGLSGTISSDRKHVSGVIDAVLNGNQQPEWTFVASVPGAKALEVAETADGSLVALAPQTGYFDMIPTPLKVAAGLVTAAAGALYFWKRRQ